MIVGGVYSFNGGKEAVESRFSAELAEVYRSIESVDAARYKTKVSAEKTMSGKLLFRPSDLNKAFKSEFTNEFRKQCLTSRL